MFDVGKCLRREYSMQISTNVLLCLKVLNCFCLLITKTGVNSMRVQEKPEAVFFPKKNGIQQSSVVGFMTCPLCGTKQLHILKKDPSVVSKDLYFLAVHLGCSKKKIFLSDFFKVGDSLELSSGGNVQEGKFTVYQVVYHSGVYLYMKVIQDEETQHLTFRYKAESRKWVRLNTFKNGRSCLLKTGRRPLYVIKKL